MMRDGIHVYICFIYNRLVFIEMNDLSAETKYCTTAAVVFEVIL
jgi:hypothetical protein